jgi:pilus assembly protein Flp/PilA
VNGGLFVDKAPNLLMYLGGFCVFLSLIKSVISVDPDLHNIGRFEFPGHWASRGRCGSGQHFTRRSLAMSNSVLSILARLHREEEGQGMVEYVLIIALVALAATAGMSSLATAINSAFSKVGSLLNSYV